jgi:hypothetical protein
MGDENTPEIRKVNEYRFFIIIIIQLDISRPFINNLNF